MRCKRCDRPVRLESEMYGFARTQSGPPDWPVHIWNGHVDCNKAPTVKQQMEET